MKRAFTLAEVLITLGIIGVVAAMTLPTVIVNYQKHTTVNKLKKAYSVINQAFKMSEAQNGEYQNWDNAEDLGAIEYFDKYLRPYMKVITVCKTYSDCKYTSDHPWFLVNGTKYRYWFLYNNFRVAFILTDGVMINVFVHSETLGHVDRKIIIDINAGNGKNTLGKDVFVLERNTHGVIQPYGIDKSNSVINNECQNTGEYCAAKIMQDGWKIKEDYPW